MAVRLAATVLIVVTFGLQLVHCRKLREFASFIFCYDAHHY